MEQQRNLVKFRAAKIDDAASLDIDKWILKLNQHKLEKILNGKSHFLSDSKSIDINSTEQHCSKIAQIYLHYFSSKLISGNLVLATVHEIILNNNSVIYGLTLREHRISRLLYFSPSWDGKLEKILTSKFNSDESINFFKTDKAKGMGCLSL